MKKPVVGVTPLYDEERESYWMLPGYMQALEACGAIALMLPLTEDAGAIAYFLETCDGFLFPGGHDVDPAVYGETRRKACGTVCRERDRLEHQVLQGAIDLDKPLLGICRGLQFLNADLGGTLYQDIVLEHSTAVSHHMQPPYDVPVHTVSIRRGTFLWEALGIDQYAVNSYHHQAVKTLSPFLRGAAYAPDGLLESAYMPGKRYIAGVQWHPEFAYRRDENSKKLFQSFVNACRCGR